MFIVCSDGDLRLVDSERIGEGRVEICFNNTFGSVCADFWDEVDAQVVCGQLGFVRNGQISFRLCEKIYNYFFFLLLQVHCLIPPPLGALFSLVTYSAMGMKPCCLNVALLLQLSVLVLNLLESDVKV